MSNNEQISTVEAIINRQNQIEQDYNDIYWYEEKELYWTNLVQTLMYNSTIWDWENDRKIDIPAYRNNKSDVDLFLAKMVEILSENFWIERENVLKYFILDDEAKKVLDIPNEVNNNSEQIKNTISSGKTLKIEWISLSNDDLVEKIWDLFYDSLSSFISALWENIDNKEIFKLLKEASKNIMNAWNICLPYVSNDFPEMKHTAEVKWVGISREELLRRIWNLVNPELSDFLEKLSVKIYKDWEADQWRWRQKLANELFESAKNLKKASEVL